MRGQVRKHFRIAVVVSNGDFDHMFEACLRFRAKWFLSDQVLRRVDMHLKSRVQFLFGIVLRAFGF